MKKILIALVVTVFLYGAPQLDLTHDCDGHYCAGAVMQKLNPTALSAFFYWRQNGASPNNQ